MPDQRVTYRRRHSYRTKNNKILLCAPAPPASPPFCFFAFCRSGAPGAEHGGLFQLRPRAAPDPAGKLTHTGAVTLRRKKTPGGKNAVHYQTKKGRGPVRAQPFILSVVLRRQLALGAGRGGAPIFSGARGKR